MAVPWVRVSPSLAVVAWAAASSVISVRPISPCTRLYFPSFEVKPLVTASLVDPSVLPLVEPSLVSPLVAASLAVELDFHINQP